MVNEAMLVAAGFVLDLLVKVSVAAVALPTDDVLTVFLLLPVELCSTNGSGFGWVVDSLTSNVR